MAQNQTRRWLSLEAAAQLLSENPESLRKKIERRARNGEAELDGIRFRKLGRLWKVLLPPGWEV